MKAEDSDTSPYLLPLFELSNCHVVRIYCKDYEEKNIGVKSLLLYLVKSTKLRIEMTILVPSLFTGSKDLFSY